MINRPSHSRTWLQKHHLALGLIALAFIACATFLVLMASASNNKVRDIKQNTAEFNTQYDKTIARLKREAEAKRKADEAEAAKVAEQAKTVTATPSTESASSCVNMLNTHNNPSAVDIMVNKAHCLSPLNFTPSDLVSVDGYLFSAKAAPSLRAMLAAAANDGLTISLTSTYRSYENQITTYNGWVATNGSTEAADTVSARPGYSEHQTGLAADLGTAGCVLECFAGTPHYAWLQQNAAKYGFVQRYYAGHEATTGYNPEAWHYRYVGTETALDMKDKGIKTLEEYWHISGGTYPH